MSFDYGVTHVRATAVKLLQKVLGIGQHGIVGGQTLAAADAYPGGLSELIKAYAEERMRYLRGVKTWSKHGRSWTIRVTGKDPKGQYKPLSASLVMPFVWQQGRAIALPAVPLTQGSAGRYQHY